MKIGAKTYSPRRPSDLDAQLISRTGYNAVETARNLSGSPIAGHVAQALLPFLPEKERPPLVVLAREIAAAGVAAVAADVRKLFGEEVLESAAAEPAAGGTGATA